MDNTYKTVMATHHVALLGERKRVVDKTMRGAVRAWYLSLQSPFPERTVGETVPKWRVFETTNWNTQRVILLGFGNYLLLSGRLFFQSGSDILQLLSNVVEDLFHPVWMDGCSFLDPQFFFQLSFGSCQREPLILQKLL